MIFSFIYLFFVRRKRENFGAYLITNAKTIQLQAYTMI